MGIHEVHEVPVALSPAPGEPVVGVRAEVLSTQEFREAAPSGTSQSLADERHADDECIAGRARHERRRDPLEELAQPLLLLEGLAEAHLDIVVLLARVGDGDQQLDLAVDGPGDHGIGDDGREARAELLDRCGELGLLLPAQSRRMRSMPE